MSILFKQKRRPNPPDRSAEQKFYLESKIRGRITLEELLEKSSENTTMDRDEIRLNLRRSFRMRGYYLALGFSVQLSSEGSHTREKATADKVTRKRIVFYPGKALRNKINKANLEKYIP